MKRKNLTITLATILTTTVLASANPIPWPPPARMPLEEMDVRIQPAGDGLHAQFGGDFTFTHIPEEVHSMLFPVPPDAHNIAVQQDGTPIPWAWSNELYPTILPEMPTIPMIEWQGPFPENGVVFTVTYEHDLIRRPSQFIFFYAVGTGKYFPTYEKTTTAYFDIVIPEGFTVAGVWLDDTPHEYELTRRGLKLTVQSQFGPITKDLIVSLIPSTFTDCGTLVRGVECVLFHADSGGLYVLEDLGGFGVGDRVRVSGIPDPFCFTICMQGDGCITQNTISDCSDQPWWWPPPNIKIVPQNPTSSDVIEITLSGQWPDTCIPSSLPILVTGNDIYFTVISDDSEVCGDAITPWSITQSVGPLSPGTYRVYASLDRGPWTLMTQFGVSGPVETRTYFFDPNRSTVVQTGGFAGIHVTYSVTGCFQLTLDFGADTASFEYVDANLHPSDSPFLYTQDMGILFNMAGLTGTIVSPSYVEFRGKTADGTMADIFIGLTLQDDSAQLTGQIVPGCCDQFNYGLDAVAFKKSASHGTAVSWIPGQSGPPAWNVEPNDPNTTEVIHFSGPTDVFSNDCVAESFMGGSPAITINEAKKTVELWFEPPPPEICYSLWAPVCGLQGHFGPLATGQWRFFSDHPRISFSIQFQVGPEPAVYYVDALTGSDDNDGLSWATAFATIQKGIDTAGDGDTIIVGDGTYVNVSGQNDPVVDFLGKAITVRSQNGPENCILSQGQQVVDFHSGETPASVLSGFTVTRGDPGSGIHCSGSSPTIMNNIITDNWSEYGMGAVFLHNSSAIIVGNIISHNAVYGPCAGIYCCHGTSATITNNTIVGNDGSSWYPFNGAVYCENGSTASRCIDAGNPGSPLGQEPLSVPDDPNNKWGENLRINMGAYGGTKQAGIPPYDWALLADLTNDGTIDYKDLAGQVEDWLTSTSEQPGDLNRDGVVNMADYALLAEDWLAKTRWYKPPIVLEVYAMGCWGVYLLDTVIMPEEGEITITSELPPQSSYAYVYAFRKGYYTEIYYLDESNTINVDLDLIVPGMFNGVIFIAPETTFPDRYLENGDVVILDGNTVDSNVVGGFQTDEQGRFAIEMEPGTYYFEFMDNWLYYLEKVEIQDQYQDLFCYPWAAVLKPNIYLYPEETTELDVDIVFAHGGWVTTSVPNYDEGWHITVEPSGIIDGQYEYLFYESLQPDYGQYEAGWVVVQDQLEGFFRSNMALTAFNQKEINDFVEYWIPLLTEYPYYAIYPQYNDELEEMIKFEFSTQPINLIRLIYSVRGLETSNLSLQEPVIPPFSREGFTVTEWGVIQK